MMKPVCWALAALLLSGTAAEGAPRTDGSGGVEQGLAPPSEQGVAAAPDSAEAPAVGNEAAAASPTGPRSEATGAASAPDQERGERFQEFIAAFTAFEPLYFLVGTDPGETRFQISFAYRLLGPETPLAQRFPWLQGFRLAYTQTSLWDLQSESAPFRDTSYKPEFHFLSPGIPWSTSWLEPLRIRLGFQHESNGRGGVESRSTNFVYIKPIAVFDIGERWALEISPKAWLYVDNDDRTNGDLPDYRGYVDLEANLAGTHDFQLATHLRWGRAGPTVQVDFTYPLTRLLLGNFDLYFQAQYFNGYAETLLRFDDHNQIYRFGLALIR